MRLAVMFLIALVSSAGPARGAAGPRRRLPLPSAITGRQERKAWASLDTAVYSILTHAFPRPPRQRILAAVEGALRQGDVHSPAATSRQAIQAALNALGDRWARYLSPQEARHAEMKVNGQRLGIGVLLLAQAGKVIVEEVTPGSPAARAGLRAGTELKMVDGRPVQSVSQALSLLRRDEGHAAVLTVQDGTRRFDVVATVSPYLSDRVEVTTTPDGIAVVRFPRFFPNVDREVRRALAAAQRRPGGLRGVVLDLRGNDGGFLHEADLVVNMFVRQGLTARYVYGDGSAIHAHADPERGIFAHLPVAALVDRRTISAGEFVPAILADLGRATVIGEPSHGKGSIQDIFSLPDGSRIIFTKGGFFTAKGTTTEGTGVVPHVSRAEATRRASARHRGKAVADPELDEAFAQIRRRARREGASSVATSPL